LPKGDPPGDFGLDRRVISVDGLRAQLPVVAIGFVVRRIVGVRFFVGVFVFLSSFVGMTYRIVLFAHAALVRFRMACGVG
jgi:hypothetical protein